MKTVWKEQTSQIMNVIEVELGTLISDEWKYMGM